MQNVLWNFSLLKYAFTDKFWFSPFFFFYHSWIKQTLMFPNIMWSKQDGALRWGECRENVLPFWHDRAEISDFKGLNYFFFLILRCLAQLYPLRAFDVEKMSQSVFRRCSWLVEWVEWNIRITSLIRDPQYAHILSLIGRNMTLLLPLVK